MFVRPVLAGKYFPIVMFSFVLYSARARKLSEEFKLFRENNGDENFS